MSVDYADVVVVGARPAGAATALLSARRGLSTILIDRSTFPSDIISTNYIHQPGVKKLERWGILKDVQEAGTPPIASTKFCIGGTIIEGGVSGIGGIVEAYAPRRFVLDTAMVNAAKVSGADLREGWTATGVIINDGRIDGITVVTDTKQERQIRCRLVVGADGKRSKVAQLVRAPVLEQHEKLTCCYYSYWHGIDTGYELHEGDGSWVGAIPTNDDATLVAVYFPQSRFKTVRADPDGSHADAVRATAPELFERMQRAERVERFWGTGDQQNFFKQAGGPGWALVGDAGHTKDSITARGITDALIQAELLINRAWRHMDSPDDLDEAVAAYSDDRYQALRSGYYSTLEVARLRVDPTRLGRIREIAGDPELSQQYCDVVAGLRPAQGLDLPTDMAWKARGENQVQFEVPG